MLKQKFPKLAVLPLDRSGEDITPVVPTRSWAVKSQLSKLFEALAPQNNIERRQYVRHFNVNGTGWQAVRELAESSRPAAEKIFDPKVLAAALPTPGVPLHTPDPIIDGARYKTLMGLMMQLGTTIAGVQK